MSQNAINNTIGSANDNTVLNQIRSSSGQWVSYNDQTDSFGLYNRSGTPEGNITANIGSLGVDTSTGTFYGKTTDASSTGWVSQINNNSTAWRYISNATPSGGNITLSLPLQSGYGARWYFFLDGVTTQVNGSNYFMEISIDNQTSWIATGYASGIQLQAWNNAAITNLNSTTFIYAARGLNYTGSGTGALTGTFWLDNSLFLSPLIGEVQYWDNTIGTIVRGQLINQLPNSASRVTDLRIRASSNIVAEGS